MVSKKLLLNAVRYVEKHGPLDLDMGLCWSVELYLENKISTSVIPYLEELQLYFEKWPEYSGEESYPVPHPDMGPIAAMGKYIATNHMWSSTEPYGQARWRLVKWLIEYLEAEIGAEKAAIGNAENN